MAGLRIDDYIFPGRADRQSHLSTRQYARLVARWVAMVGLYPITYGTHSLRRTKATLMRIPVNLDTGSGVKLDSGSGESDHLSERSDAGVGL